MNYAEKINAPELDGQSAYVYTVTDPAECAAFFRAELAERIRPDVWESRAGWYGGESFNDALAYATTGNEKLVKLADEYLSKIEHGGIETSGHEWAPSLCGAYPVVGDFLAGRPDCMRRRLETSAERAPVRLILDTTSSGGITADKLHRRGAAMLALVMALAQTRPVELWQACALDARRKGANGYQNAAAVLVRCPTSPLNLGVCAHVLTSQAWTRGLGYTFLNVKLAAGGGWSFCDPSPGKGADTYNRLMRTALDCEPQDVLVNGVYLHDELVDRPVEWINEQLKRCKEIAAEEA